MGVGNGTTLKDIDFADDLCLLTVSRDQLQSKTDDLASAAAKEGLRINCHKTKDMRLNTSDVAPIYINGRAVAVLVRTAF